MNAEPIGSVSIPPNNVQEPNKRKTGAGEKKKSRSSAGSKLPFCPEGATETISQVPCRRRQPKKRRKRTFRVPLKKEDGSFESQVIEYNCEFPNRVVVRLEYLMQSTKVRLNDREWLKEFYEKLVEEETRAMRDSIREREKGELTRMKRLIIEGIDRDIPDELAYLAAHPVFRVNRMLERLAAFDSGLLVEVGDNDDITPVEPYEYDGNHFFQNLHENGTIWIPDEQRDFEGEKLLGKVYRAKLRLKQKREQKASEDKVLRLLNSPTHPDTLSLIEELAGENTIDHSIGALVDRLQTKANMTLNRIDEKIRKSKVLEMEKAKVLEKKRYENERKFMHHTNQETTNLWSSGNSELERDVIFEVLRQEREETVGPDDRILTIRMRMHDYKEQETLKARHSLDTRKSIYDVEGSVMDRLKYVYKLPENENFSDYEPWVDDFVTDLDIDLDFKKFSKATDRLTLMYDRQKLVTEDHMKGKQRNKEQ